MKTHSERLRGYMDLLKGWKDSRPPTPSDLKAWQEIWTISDDDLVLVEELAFKSQKRGWKLWDEGFQDKALEIWDQGWSLSPRDLDFHQKVFDALEPLNSPLFLEKKTAYKLRITYLKNGNVWKGIDPKLRKYLGAGMISAGILTGVLLLLPLLGPWVNPPPDKTPPPSPTGQTRALPTIMYPSLSGTTIKEAASALNIFPETQILSISGTLKTGDTYYQNLDIQASLKDTQGNVLSQRKWSLTDGISAPSGGGFHLPFRKDFLLTEENLQGASQVFLELYPSQRISPPPGPGTPLIPTTAIPLGEFDPGFIIQDLKWEKTFSSWKPSLLLEAQNRGVKPIQKLMFKLIWVTKVGETIMEKSISLVKEGFPSLKAGEKLLYLIQDDYPEELYDFTTGGFPSPNLLIEEIN